MRHFFDWFRFDEARDQSLLHHVRISCQPRTAKWNVEDLIDYFQAYLHMKNSDGVKEVVSSFNSQPNGLQEGTCQRPFS